MNDPLLSSVGEFMDAVETRLRTMRAEIRNELLHELQPLMPSGVNGKDGAPGLRGEKGEAGKDGPCGKDGQNGKDGRDGIDGKPGQKGEAGKDGKDGAAGLNGKDGTDGRDGRDGSAGKDGKDGVTMDQVELAAQRIAFKMLGEIRPEGRTLRLGDHVVELALPEYRGVWKDGSYLPGDFVTWNGSVWHCGAATTDKPGAGSTAWTLAVKAGRDGKDLRA